ncbi:MAG: SDR family oxidoreductase [Actinobacteria bacterium]|nr:MAG: SDR family oxidoreductase [Actinomycetota bacterium]
MRVCILGAGGMLGHMLVRTLSDSHDVYGTSKQQWTPDAGLAKFLVREKWLGGVDAKDITTVTQIFKNQDFDVVINCIGVVKQRASRISDDEMTQINAQFPHELVKVSNSCGARMIHISTDCVFSGNRGDYVETDFPDPVDVYGSSKLSGEIVDDRNLTIRTSHVGRELSNFTSLFEWILSNRNKQVTGFSKAIYSGLTTFSLSELISQLLTIGSEITGLVHVASTPITKFKLITELNDRLGLGIKVNADESVVVDRSLRSSQKLHNLGIKSPSWDQMLDLFCKDQASYDFVTR